MSVILTNARLIDPEKESETLGTIAFDDGIITRIDDSITNLVKAIDCKGKYLAPGIIDIGVQITEPGERHKESFKTAGLAAAKGGVTTLIMRSDTKPSLDSPEMLEFVKRRAGADAKVTILPMGALTKNRAGQEMAELSFLKDAGAIAFGDADHVITDNKILARCMTYAKGLDGLIVAHAQDSSFSKDALATSGALATKLGLASVPAIAERMELARLLSLVEMTQSKLHIDQITTERALPLLKRAKENGLQVTAGTSIHHLTLNEHDIEGYRTFFKMKPPLRAEEDRLALVEALHNGLIDVISSLHTPQDEESKRLPFEIAATGAIALETLLPAALRLVHNDALSLPKLWRALSLNPARLLGLPSGRLTIGSPADLILFDADKPFKLDRMTLISKSKNTPFDGQLLQGKVLKTWVKGEAIYEDDF